MKTLLTLLTFYEMTLWYSDFSLVCNAHITNVNVECMKYAIEDDSAVNVAIK